MSDLDAWNQGGERLLVVGVGRDAQRSHGPSMEGVRKAHDLGFVAGEVVLRLTRRSRPARLPDLPCNLQCALVRLGPRVREEDLRAARAVGKGVRAAWCESEPAFLLSQGNEELCQLPGMFVVVDVTRME